MTQLSLDGSAQRQPAKRGGQRLTGMTHETLCQFMGPAQRQAIYEGLRGEEREAFVEILKRLAGHIAAMPATYGNEGVADPTVWLHYFTGSCDWYITEKDVDTDGEGQRQAFGLANLGHGGELGYISLVELMQYNRVELDFHFTPCPLSKVQK